MGLAGAEGTGQAAGGASVDWEAAAGQMAGLTAAKEAALLELRRQKEDVAGTLDLLPSLPSKTRHQVMVPLGGGGLPSGAGAGGGPLLAFQEGELVHTNEVFVRLGEEALVERTPEQAAGILKRRAASLEAAIGEAEKEVQSMRSSLALAAELYGQRANNEAGGDNIIDIREDYVSDDEGEGMGEAEAGKGRGKGGKHLEVSDGEFEDMLVKLERLERLERFEAAAEAKTEAKAGAEPSSQPGPPTPTPPARATAGSSSSTSPSRSALPAPVASAGSRPAEAFTGSVVEKGRRPVAAMAAPRQAGAAEQSDRQGEKPRSRFKMSRMKQ